jgi:hypothetical protein
VNLLAGTGDPMDIGSYVIYPSDRVYHGTVVSGVIGAVGNNGTGIAGLNWNIQMMAIRAMGGDFADATNLSLVSFLAHTVAAYDYLLEMKNRGVNVRVVNSCIVVGPEELDQQHRLACFGMSQNPLWLAFRPMFLCCIARRQARGLAPMPTASSCSCCNAAAWLNSGST